MSNDHTDDIRTAFNQAIADPTGASDAAFCRAMWCEFSRIFAEELVKEMAATRPPTTVENAGRVTP